MGLAFGCIDLAVDKKDNIHFFEINQGGHFLFVEEAMPSLPLLSAMCSMLTTGDINYSLANSKNISFKEYIQTDSYIKFIKRTEYMAKTDQLLNKQIIE